MASDPDRGSISLTTATSITIANMVGTGVFTSLGFQVVDLHSGFALLLLWVIGGIFALCGALSYGELAAALPRSGGEFHFLGRIYHPAFGFLAGWVSFTAGFAAPIALAAHAFGSYLGQVVRISPLVLSCGVVVLVTAFHLRSLRLGSYFQNIFTLFKIALIVVFALAAWLFSRGRAAEIDFAPSSEALGDIASLPFGISLLYVMFAYSGWNAAVYIVGEVREPARDVPRALFLGTAIVLVLYVALNAVFLYTTPIDMLAGKIEIGHVVATHVFGDVAGQMMSTLLSIALVSTISAMVWAGPRVTQMMGEDYPFFAVLARTRNGIPALAILTQSALVLVLLVTSSFDEILVFTQFTLTASSFLAVLGVFVLRRKAPDLPRPYKTWGYPVTPLLFVAISLVIMIYTLIERPWESLAGMATLAVGLAIHAALTRKV